MARQLMVCSTCGQQGYPESHTRGSFLIELALYVFFCFPGIIYTLWRLTTKQQVCQQCKNPTMIPLSSPMGQDLGRRFQST